MITMNELIEISNFILINYWWLVLPVCVVLGYLSFGLTHSNFDNEQINNHFLDSGMTWDKYGNPIIGDDENNEI